MKNSYLDHIVSRICDGEDLGLGARELACSYKREQYKKYGRICINDAIHSVEKAIGIAKNLSLAGINELYITGEWSNQFELWLAMDCFGLKMRGISSIENPDYERDMERWGESDKAEMIPAIRFSFTEDEK